MSTYATTLGQTPYDDIGLLGEFDVVVLGGGPAGIAAAATAGEAGFNTLLYPFAASKPVQRSSSLR